MSVCLNLVYTIIFNSLGIPNFVNINQSDFFFIRLEIHKEWYISSLTKEKKKKIISISKNLKRKIGLINF
jgi:hypothetical protein